MKNIFVCFFLILCFGLFGQSVTGTSGLIHIPSARMLEDGKLVIGAAYIPKPYFQRYDQRINPGLNTYVTFGILPFVEVMFRYTHELNMRVSPETRYFPDRMFGIRARVIEEKKYNPAIVIGLQDASAIIVNTCLGCSNYSVFYFVGTKNFKSDLGDFDLTVGHTFNFSMLKSKDYKGFFGGISFTPNIFRNASILFENNTKGFNLGVRLIAFSRFNLLFGTWNIDKPTFSINYMF